MSLNKSKGNMYPFVDYTWNPIRGKCPHGCTYCFMRDRKVGPLRLDEKALEDNLGTGRTIFVGSSTDMWADAVPVDWIIKVLNRCRRYNNTYIFQSKNPARFASLSYLVRSVDIIPGFSQSIILGTTLESNREYDQSMDAPPAWARLAAFENEHLDAFRKMVSIEPIMAFDLDVFLKWLRAIKPAFVSIGADSKGHKLPEPKPEELDMLVVALREFTEVKLKENLARIMLKDYTSRV